MSTRVKSVASATPEWWAEREAFVVAQLARGDMTPRARRELEGALEVVRRAIAERRQSHAEAVRP